MLTEWLHLDTGMYICVKTFQAPLKNAKKAKYDFLKRTQKVN